MSENYSDFEEMNQVPEKRPVFLTVLCILSFIAIGFGLLGLLFSLIKGKPSVEEAETAYNMTIQMARDMDAKGMKGVADFLKAGADLTMYQQENFWKVMGMNFVTLTTGLISVIFMMKGKKLGFHLYIVYNLLSIGGSFLVFPSHMIQLPVVIINLIISGVFVLMYSRNLRWMNK